MSRQRRHRIGTMRRTSIEPFEQVIQYRLQAVSSVSCESTIHQSSSALSAKQSWQVRFYQNPQRLLELQALHLDEEQITQRLWDETCEEQDARGPCIHLVQHWCSACVTQVFQEYTGKQPLVLAMATAQLTGGTFLIASHRRTLTVGIIPLPSHLATIDETGLLPALRDLTAIPINLEPR